MILLFLIVLGTANVNAQVRIGGNAAPNASALLDLNATDAIMAGTKGLALPRVDLTSNTMLLSGVTSNLTGMMVYNTTTTVGRIGIYYWNGAQWVLASLPSTSASDSGRFLMTTPLGPIWTYQHADSYVTGLALIPRSHGTVTWTLVLDTTVTLYAPHNALLSMAATGILHTDVCTSGGWTGFNVIMGGNNLIYLQIAKENEAGRLNQTRIRCYRASI